MAGDGYISWLFPRKLCIFAFGYASRRETECCLESNKLKELYLPQFPQESIVLQLTLFQTWVVFSEVLPMHKPRNFVSCSELTQVWYRGVCPGDPQMSRSRDSMDGAMCKHSLKIIPDHDNTHFVNLTLSFFAG